jgi:putative SOS response-associated peptidase YedK
MAEIHNTKKRMPVILTPQNENDWLNDAINPFAFKVCNIHLKATAI